MSKTRDRKRKATGSYTELTSVGALSSLAVAGNTSVPAEILKNKGGKEKEKKQKGVR